VTVQEIAESLPVDSIYRRLLEHGEEADVPAIWRKYTWPQFVYSGQCEPQAFKYLERHVSGARIRREPVPIEGVVLVHGTMRSPRHRGWLRHAWVELPGDVVFDGVVQRFFTRESFYRVMGAHALIRYSWSEARRLSRTPRRPYGPWHRRRDRRAGAGGAAR
jgi:hypothetical protein